MKKPDFIQIEFPLKKGTKQSAATKYLGRLAGKVLDIYFADGGRRSTFHYQVKTAYPETWTEWRGKIKKSVMKVQLELIRPKEEAEKE